ncbi:SRPBCC family protein [Cumulibacter manganitolerans]|uniref:hypothetical protein n=1 Tax=Cumulibacter manganitolerans TaxID=1884992 RepID=UPI0012968B71|nr:hypothetical protein [Cumulibacter manganitolerans]
MSPKPAEPATHLRVSVVTDARIPRLFDYLSVPAHHVRIDGSGTLVSADDRPITAVGDTFRVHMDFAPRGKYVSENHVVAFVPDVQIAWMPARPGRPPLGIRWDWEFDVGPKGETVVTLTCDWSRVTDPEYLATYRLPRISAEEMRLSIKRLIDLVSSYS